MTPINRKYIIFIIVIVVIIGGAFLLDFRETTNSPNYQNISSERNIYHIVVAKQSPSSEIEDISLEEYLEHVFELPKESIADIVYDVREGSPHDKNYSPLNFSYYILIKGEPVKLKSNYENKNIVVKTKIGDEKLIPYITNPDYCELDSDCIIRDDFCSYGSFNYYHGFYDVYGCISSDYTEFECDTSNPSDECSSYNCTQDVEYEGVKCIKNKCVAEKKIGECTPWQQ